MAPPSEVAPSWSRFARFAKEKVESTVEPFFLEKSKKLFHHIKSGTVLKTVPLFLRWYYFGSYLAQFHEEIVTVSKRYHHIGPMRAKMVPL